MRDRRSIILMLVVAFPHVTCADGPSPAELVRRGNAALQADKPDEALAAYKEAEIARPESPRIQYNRGLAQYRKREFEQAKELFRQALSTRDLDLEAAAHYNLGNCAYSQALEKLTSFDEAIELAQEAIGAYRRTLELNPDDADAKANIETARLLIKDLRDKKKKEEEKKKDQPQSQPSSQPQSQPSSRPQSQPSSQPNQDQADKQQGQQKPQDKKQQQEQERKKQDKSQQNPQDSQQKKEQQKQAGGKPQERKLSREEAQRLLQAIRDKEKERRRARVRRQSVGRMTVEKDW